jgi:hypothetical protein
MFKVLMVVGTIQSMVNQTMPHPNCDVVKIADDYAKARWPFFDFSDRRRSTVIEGDVAKVRFLLPDRSLGYEPEISIDRRSCQVAHAVIWQ